MLTTMSVGMCRSAASGHSGYSCRARSRIHHPLAHGGLERRHRLNPEVSQGIEKDPLLFHTAALHTCAEPTGPAFMLTPQWAQ